MEQIAKEVIEREAKTCLSIASNELGMQNILFNSCETVEPGEETNLEYETKMDCHQSHMLSTFWEKYEETGDMIASIIKTVDSIADEYRIRPYGLVNRAVSKSKRTHEIICSYAERGQVLAN